MAPKWWLSSRSKTARYLVPVAAVAACTALRAALDPWLDGQAPPIVYVFGIMFSAFAGGFGPGVFATLLSLLIGHYFFFEPRHVLFVMELPHEPVVIVLYFLVGLFISLLCGILRRYAERAGRNAEQLRLFKFLAERSADPFYVISPSEGFRFVYVNDAACRHYGRSREELLKLSIPEFDPLFDPKRVETFWGELKAKRAMLFETEHLHADGRRIPVEVSVNYLQFEGQELLCGWFHDISARRLTEEAVREASMRLRFHVDNSPLAVIEWDREFRVTRWGGEAQRIFGWEEREVLGKSPEELRLVYEEDEPEVSRIVTWLREGTVPRCFSANRNYRKDRRVIHCEWRNSALTDGSGKASSILSLVMDITDRKRMEEQLTIAMREVEEASRAKDHFLAVLSHELRTPLAPVLTGVSILQENQNCDEEMRELLTTIRRNVEFEVQLIDDLLDMTRIARGKVELSTRPVRLSEILEVTVAICQSGFEAKRLHFSLDIGDAASCMLNADPLRLQQVFWNLLKNATKFTPAGGCVGIRCRLQEEGHVLTEVHDSGIGIDAAAIGRIFSAFEQAERSVTQRFGGLGLGLAISKALVELHGGTITVQSEGKGKGATFGVVLPIVSAGLEVASIREGGSAAERQMPNSQEMRSLRILLVEDHADTARLMRRVLEQHGHWVQVAGDVAGALQIWDGGCFDLLLSDLGLPDGSGNDLVRELRRRGVRTPAIALSGYGQEQDVRATQEAGFAEHITKPANPDLLLRTLARVGGSWSAEVHGVVSSGE